MGNRVEASSGFLHVTPDNVPEGKATLRRDVGTAEGVSQPMHVWECKAYAFDTVKAACYFFSGFSWAELSVT